MGVLHSLRSWHLNKPHSFYTSTCLSSLTFIATGSWTCILFLFTICVYFVGTVWASVSPKGPGFGSQLPVTGHPRSKQDCGDFSAAIRNFSWGISLYSFSRLHKPGMLGWWKEMGFLRAIGPQDYLFEPACTLGVLYLCCLVFLWHLGFMSLGLWATWVWLELFVVPVRRLSLLFGLCATWTLCHLGPVRLTCGTSW